MGLFDAFALSELRVFHQVPTPSVRSCTSQVVVGSPAFYYYFLFGAAVAKLTPPHAVTNRSSPRYVWLVQHFLLGVCMRCTYVA